MGQIRHQANALAPLTSAQALRSQCGPPGLSADANGVVRTAYRQALTSAHVWPASDFAVCARDGNVLELNLTFELQLNVRNPGHARQVPPGAHRRSACDRPSFVSGATDRRAWLLAGVANAEGSRKPGDLLRAARAGRFPANLVTTASVQASTFAV